jgi:hypothetical protein
MGGSVGNTQRGLSRHAFALGDTVIVVWANGKGDVIDVEVERASASVAHLAAQPQPAPTPRY